MTVTLHCGDNRIILRDLADNSVDAIVCDPPYELGFMGKRWDSSGIAYDVTLWAECLRVLKPGGHLIAFGGTRTYHRMTVAIEDAGFEIRDCLSYLYGSGFPKSLDVSKAIDKRNTDNQQKRAQEQLERRYRFTEWVRSTGLTSRQIDEATGTNMGGHYTTAASQPAIMTRAHLDAVRHLIGDIPEWVESEVGVRTLGIEESEAWKAREFYETPTGGLHGGTGNTVGKFTGRQAKPGGVLDAAKQWHGFGTALKPAHEPAVLARKPLTGTVADNVMTWGTGALNIDGCRVAYDGKPPTGSGSDDNLIYGRRKGNDGNETSPLGRWPANLILDEEAAALLDAQSGVSRSSAAVRNNADFKSMSKGYERAHMTRGHNDIGGASRFFYTAKASRAEREAGLEGMEVRNNMRVNAPRENEEEKHATQRANHHPTVKPLDLMRYLVRLVTPPGGIVLDPFMGSGSTGCAAVLEGMSFIGIDITPEYVEIARRRIAHHGQQPPLI